MVMEFPAKILKIIQESPDVLTFQLQVPDEFTFKPGQFVMLGTAINGQKAEKAYSISSSPTRKGFIDITKKMSDSEYSKKLHELNEGDTLNVKGPYGVFVLNESEMNTILLAGGIGITPFRCYMQYVIDKKLPNKITVFYSNRTPEEIAFLDEFRQIEKSCTNIKIINTVTRPQESKAPWSGLTGRVDANMIKQHADITNALYYACGPPAMVEAMISIVTGMGIPKQRVRIEKW